MLYDNLPHGQWPVILADPPWHYTNYSGVRWEGRTADTYYDTLTLEQLMELPVHRMTAMDVVLFLWATPPCLPEAMTLLGRWRFTYKTIALTWVKMTKDGTRPRLGMGYYTRANAELCLLATHGHGLGRSADRSISQIIHAPRGEHSRKPNVQYTLIERMYPGLRYLELFARPERMRANWTYWGNESGT